MTLTIELFKSTGTPETSEIVTNNNFKVDGQANSLAEYYFYPITRPEGSDLLSESFANMIFAKLSGTYTKFSRPRWKIEVPDLTLDKAKLFVGRRNVYAEPDGSYDGSLAYLNDTTVYLFPNTGLTDPTNATSFKYDWTTNQTVFSDYLVMQLLTESGSDTDIGNIQPIKITLEVDLSE